MGQEQIGRKINWEVSFERIILWRTCLGEGEEQNKFSETEADQTKENFKPKL